MTLTDSEQATLPPSPFIKYLGERLSYGPLDILDVGCCMGRNALYLATFGHNVVGVDLEFDHLKTAKRRGNKSVEFVAADVRKLPFRNQFDLVIMNEVLHTIPREEFSSVLQALNNITKPGGFNAVSGYVGDKPQALKPRELYSLYANQNWEVIETFEDETTAVAYRNIEELTSLAGIIAIKNF